MVVLFTPHSLHSTSDVNSSGSFALGQEQYQDKLVPVTVGVPADDERLPWVYKFLNPVEVTAENPEHVAFREVAERLKGVEPAANSMPSYVSE
jgi:hypothetical protein